MLSVCRILLRKTESIYEDLPNSYWRNVLINKICAILRGAVKQFRMGEHKGVLMCGKHVIINNPQYMSIGNKVILGDFVKIQAMTKQGIILGNNVQIGDYSVINGTSIPSFIGIGLKIGDRCSFGEYCHFGAVGGIEIGNNVIAGQNIRLHAENHIFEDANILINKQGVTHQGIKIGNNCWIGAGAVFLDGTILGDGCVVAANAVLKGEYPKNAVIIGAPGKVRRIRGE